MKNLLRLLRKEKKIKYVAAGRPFTVRFINIFTSSQTASRLWTFMTHSKPEQPKVIMVDDDASLCSEENWPEENRFFHLDKIEKFFCLHFILCRVKFHFFREMEKQKKTLMASSLAITKRNCLTSLKIDKRHITIRSFKKIFNIIHRVFVASSPPPLFLRTFACWS